MDTIALVSWIILGLTVAIILINPKSRNKIIDIIKNKIDEEREISTIRNTAYKEERKKAAVIEGKVKAYEKLNQKQNIGKGLNTLIKQSKGLKGKGLKLNIDKPKEEPKEEFSNLKKMMGIDEK